MSNVYKSLLYTTRNTRSLFNISVKNLSTLSKIYFPLPGSYKYLTTNFLHPILDTNIFVKHLLSSSGCNLGLDERNVDFFENEMGPDEMVKSEPSSLYSNLNDHIINRLDACSSIQDVFEIFRDSSDHLKHYHILKTVLVLWNMQKVFNDAYINNLGKYDVKMSPMNMMMEYATGLKSHAEFHHILKQIEHHCTEFNIEELSHCVYFLGKMGFNMDNKVFNTLMDLCDKKLNSSPNDWTLYDLARYTGSVKIKDNLKFILSIKETIPYIVNHLENCKTIEDFRLVTACMDKIHILISKNTINTYVKKVWEFIESNIFTENDKETILKVVAFINLPHWLKRNSTLNSAICTILENKIDTMDAAEVIVLHKAFQSHLEPANLLGLIQKRANYLLEEIKSDDRVKVYSHMPDLLFCQVTTSVPQKRDVYEAICVELIEICFPTSLPSIYKVLRFLKTTNRDIYDKFWKKALDEMCSTSFDYDTLLKLCHKYMFFNNHTYTLYRNVYFEKTLISLLLQSLHDGVHGMVPWKFSRISAFMFAYGMSWKNSVSETNTINELMNKLDSMNGQLDVLDCLVLSRSLLILSKSTRKMHRLSHVNHIPVRLNSLLDNCVLNHLQHQENSLVVLNCICKTFITRKARYDTEQFYRLLENFARATGDFTSRSIRDAVFNFISCNYVIPHFMDRAIDYIVHQNENILGETAHKVIHFCYVSGYTPKNIDFFQTSTKLVERDKHIMSGLSLIQTCIALCFYGHLPHTLVKYIFSIEFMERLDNEIAGCYFKLTYPAIVRNKLMDLNRSVCLEYPQFQVPWFHEKYIEEIIALTPTKLSALRDEVLNTLKNSLNLENSLVYPYYTSYGYRVDFMLQLDDKDVPITLLNPRKLIPKTKIAILLMDGNNCYFKTFNSTKEDEKEKQITLELSGASQSNIRHLEQLDYRVVTISPSLWFSMYMTEPDAKVNYLREKILTSHK